MKCAAALIALAVSLAPLFAQQSSRPTVSLEGSDSVPRFVNAAVTQRALNGSLATAMTDIARSSDGPIWAGYAVPGSMSKNKAMCCWQDSECTLENDGGRYIDSNRTGDFRPASDLFVFVRFERGQVTRVRPMGANCVIDASKTSVHWLTGVPSSESVSYLLSLASRDDAHGFSSSAISAISFHADPAAQQALERLVEKGQPNFTREQAAFWIASEGSQHALDVIRKLVREDSDERFRRHLAFCLSIVPGDDAVRELIRMAHDDSSPGVRGQALFWMAQKAGAQMAADIASSIQNDPEAQVKERAVFALSQMPNGAGVPKLIEVARTNRTPSVRKQAVFWLGQSRDPQALKFIEDVITH